ncbi:MAG: acetylxylan esterase [Spirosomataceae bacterium]
MTNKHKSLFPVILFFILTGFGNLAFAQGPGPGQRPAPSLPPIPIKGDTTHTLTKHFIAATAAPKMPDASGFIQRWLVLEPIKKNIVRNNIFTDNYLRTTFATDNFSNDYRIIPKTGEMVKVGDQNLQWYALDCKTFNFNLFHFTYALNKPRYGILVWLVTVINCTEDIENVRMSAGCNSGSMWWLNEQEVLLLSGDRDMIADNVTSQRLTLKKGKNIIRGAVINGPGIANFAVRFIDEKGLPVKNFTISNE